MTPVKRNTCCFSGTPVKKCTTSERSLVATGGWAKFEPWNRSENIPLIQLQ